MRVSRNATCRSKWSSSSVAVRAGAESTRRSANECGWNHAPCQGSSRLARTSSGSQVPTIDATATRLSVCGGRTGRIGASVGSSPPTASRRTQARTPSSWAGIVRHPARPAGPSARPCQRQISSQPDCCAVDMSAPRCGQAPGPACSPPSGARHTTSSTPATVVPSGVPTRTSREGATTNQLPDGRAFARSRAALMIPGFASRQVGSMASQRSPDRRRNGLAGSRVSGRFFSTLATLGRAGCGRSGAERSVAGCTSRCDERVPESPIGWCQQCGHAGTQRPDRRPHDGRSRSHGHDRQRGPPRPDPSSNPSIVTTSIPASRIRSFVVVFRS